MPVEVLEVDHLSELRSRALSRLGSGGRGERGWSGSTEALGVLHDLAATPATAVDALALLHELQVHQVELDLQEEELRQARAELEQALDRQLYLYNHAPVAYLSLDLGGSICELNLTAARLLGPGVRRAAGPAARPLSDAAQLRSPAPPAEARLRDATRRGQLFAAPAAWPRAVTCRACRHQHRSGQWPRPAGVDGPRAV